MAIMNLSIAGDTTFQSLSETNPVCDYYWTYPYWQPYVEHNYYPYYSYWQLSQNKIEMAFKIVKVLMDKKFIKPEKITVDKFIELVTDISKEI